MTITITFPPPDGRVLTYTGCTGYSKDDHWVTFTGTDSTGVTGEFQIAVVPGMQVRKVATGG